GDGQQRLLGSNTSRLILQSAAAVAQTTYSRGCSPKKYCLLLAQFCVVMWSRDSGATRAGTEPFPLPHRRSFRFVLFDRSRKLEFLQQTRGKCRLPVAR